MLKWHFARKPKQLGSLLKVETIPDFSTQKIWVQKLPFWPFLAVSLEKLPHPLNFP